MMPILNPLYALLYREHKMIDTMLFCHFQLGIAPMSLIYVTVILVQSHEKYGAWGQTDVIPHVLHYGWNLCLYIGLLLILSA